MGTKSYTFPGTALRKLIVALACSMIAAMASAQNATATENFAKNEPSPLHTSSTDSSLPTASFADENLAGEKDTEHSARKEQCTFGERSLEWLDNLRYSTHGRLCNTVRWIDGLFGDEHEFNDEDFRGKITIGFRQDEEDGFDPRLRVKLRTRLPNVSERFNAFIGRVEEDSFISNTEVNRDQLNTVGLRSVDDDDAEWLVGIGYRNPDKRDNGLDFSVGAKLSSGLNPYAKAAYRYVFVPSDRDFWKTTQTVFWRRDEGYGVSSNLDYIHLLNDQDILQWESGIKYADEFAQWEWITSGSWHHSFSDKKGVSSRAYVRGEEENPVSIPEFGVTFTHVRPFLRPWLAIELGVDFRWIKDDPDREYHNDTRIGVQFEMQLGDYYNRIGERLRK